MLKIALLMMMVVLLPMTVAAQAPSRHSHSASSPGITIHGQRPVPADTVDTLSSSANRNIFRKILDYFDDSNSERSDKRFDVSFIGGPHYSSDTKLGLGLVAAGIYSSARSDSLTPKSNVSLYGDLSTSGFYLLGIRGNHIFPRDRYRLNYNLYFFSFPSKFWGMGYDMGADDHNETDYDRYQSKISVEFLARAIPNLYIGPLAQFNYVIGRHADNPALWMGQRMHTFNIGPGFKVQYDTRDHLTNAYSGIFLELGQRFFARFMGNDYAFSSTELSANSYHSVWRGGVIATQIHALLNYGDVPWGMMATVGGSNTLRGYYEGRYRDKNEADVTVELRQHIWRRNGIVLWAGLGAVFPRFDALRWRMALPNFGIGYRWEFKKRVNVRLDYGFGKHESGFLFSINEAF